MVIVDKVSFMSCKMIDIFEGRCKSFKDAPNLNYGGLDIVFVGDLHQLEPCKGGWGRLYDSFTPEWHGMLNCYLELNGMHCFNNDILWGEILLRFRNGKLTHDDIDIINECAINDNQDIPDNIAYATYTNLDSAAINIALFKKYCTLQQEVQFLFLQVMFVYK